MREFLLAPLLASATLSQTPSLNFEKQKTEILQYYRPKRHDRRDRSHRPFVWTATANFILEDGGPADSQRL